MARLTEAFSFFTKPTFVERLEELLPPVEYVAPGLIGQDRDVWISSVKKARNLEAHRFVRTATQLKANHNQRTDDYYQLAVSTEWVLRISLLLHLGVDPELLHARLLDHGKFLFALANMDVSRFAWPGSRLKEFRASRTRGPTRRPSSSSSHVSAGPQTVGASRSRACRGIPHPARSA